MWVKVRAAIGSCANPTAACLEQMLIYPHAHLALWPTSVAAPSVRVSAATPNRNPIGADSTTLSGKTGL